MRLPSLIFIVHAENFIKYDKKIANYQLLYYRYITNN